MLAVTAALAITELEDPLLLAAFAAAADGAVFFSTYGEGTREDWAYSLAVQALVAVFIIPMVYFSLIVAGMEVYARLFKAKEHQLHKDHTELGPDSFGPTPRQQGNRANDLLALMGRAAELAEGFNTRILEALMVAGGAAGRPCEKVGPNLKGEDRAREKAKNDYNGKFEQLCDLLRGIIVVDHYDDMLACFDCLKQLENEGTIRIIRLKNRFKNGSIAGAGYCDANVSIEFEGHVCEVQLQYRPFYDLKKGQHKVYEVVRSLQIEGALAEVPAATPIPFHERVTVVLLLLFVAVAGLWQCTLYRFYNWCSFGIWNAKDGELADVHAACLMTPFLLLSYVSMERLYRMLRCRNRSLTLAMQGISAVGIILFGFCFDASVLEQKPDPKAWFALGDGFWSQEYNYYAYGDASRAYLKPPEGSECLSVVITPYVLVGALFLRDFAQTLRGKETGVRRRPRVGMVYDEFLGPHGEFFEHRLLLLQLMTVVLQATEKLPVLGAAVWSAHATRSSTLEVGNGVAVVAYWVMVVALTINSFYPAVLLQWAEAKTVRDASMGLDATLDVVYFSTVSIALHQVAGPASTPVWMLSYFATFYPVFHAFSVACGLELATMQRAAVSSKERDEMLQKARPVRRMFAWCAAFLKALVVVGAIIHLCAEVHPMQSRAEVHCDPCVCTGDAGFFKVTSCDAAAAVSPNEIYMDGRQLGTIERGVFSHPGFDALTVVDLSGNSITAMESLPPAVEFLDLSFCGMDEAAAFSLSTVL